MNDSELDSGFAAAVRAELVAVGTKTSRLKRHQRRIRLAVACIIAIGAVATTGAAIVVNGFPGTTTVAPIGTAVAVTHTGTATIDLGPAANGANTVILDVTCISATGSISVPSTDGFLAAGSTSITVTADPGTTWKAIAQYRGATTSDWGVNAHGQTYGAPNAKTGFPDLQGAQATNGKLGFIYVKEFSAFKGIGCINVYQSDGVTVIGKFGIGTVTCHGDPATITKHE